MNHIWDINSDVLPSGVLGNKRKNKTCTDSNIDFEQKHYATKANNVTQNQNEE